MNNVILNEEDVMNYNKWVQGIASREFSSKKVFIKDLLGKPDEGGQYPNQVINNNIIPYPLNNLIPTLGTVITNLGISLNLTRSSLNNPVLKEGEENTANIHEAIKNLEEASKYITKAVNNLDNLKIAIKMK